MDAKVEELDEMDTEVAIGRNDIFIKPFVPLTASI